MLTITGMIKYELIEILGYFWAILADIGFGCALIVAYIHFGPGNRYHEKTDEFYWTLGIALSFYLIVIAVHAWEIWGKKAWGNLRNKLGKA